MAARDVFDGYIRVSRVGDRVERLRSPEFQEREIRREAKQRGLRVGRVISDLDQSGGRDDRPGLLEAMERIESGESAGIIVAKLDRFSRNLTQATALAKRIMDAGGRIYSYAEPADWTSSDGELQIHLALAIAQHQRRRANEYFETAKQSAVERGVAVNPRIAPGYRRDEATRRLVVDRKAASVIQEVFERRTMGAGPATLADLLEAGGVTTSMGSETWSKAAVYALLKNRIYLGELKYAEHVNVESHEAIVDRATWEAAQRQVAKLPKSAARWPFALTGLARCWACRYALQGTTSSHGKRIYRCTVRHAGGRCPDPCRIAADEFELVVSDAFRRRILKWPAMQQVVDTGALDAARAAVLEAERELAGYRDDTELRDVIGRDAWLDGLRARRAVLDQGEDELARVRLATPTPQPDLRFLVDELPNMTLVEQREAMGQLIDVVALRSAASAKLPVDRVVVFWAGEGPSDLPRRGFREKPELRPFELPPGVPVRA
ncbi:integrase [Paraconexibacter sp. AEG42_29]|uniref:Integrase n=1 Tax=Paraconexibacter sp. AEG42_29 TaxID=2997339 RepID=A0AAU7APW1_9ACTN